MDLLRMFSENPAIVFQWNLSETQVWISEFKDLLRIRKKNHHSKCSQCLRHRLIIRKLGHNPVAMRSQVRALQEHLRRQYADRQVYWRWRSESRACSESAAPAVLTLIVDSMDAAKHAWPRSRSMMSKEFASWSRPRLSSTTVLAHGRLVLTVLSPHFLPSNSSRSVEVVSHALSVMQTAGCDLRGTHLVLQGDNASKELKNNCLLQWAAQQVAVRRLGQCSLSFLSSGHSHEDIDGLFSVYSQWLDRKPEVHTPHDFKTAYEEFLAKPDSRPHEPLKRVLIMSRFRDWSFSFTYGSSAFVQKNFLRCCNWEEYQNIL